MPNPSRAIREIAAMSQSPDVRRRLLALAAEFETQHNKQNNDWQVVISRIEERMDDSIDELRSHIQTEFATSRANQQKFLEMLGLLQNEIRALCANTSNGE